MKQELFFDVIILGSGPAGFSAAIYAARGNVKTAILDISMFEGILTFTSIDSPNTSIRPMQFNQSANLYFGWLPRDSVNNDGTYSYLVYLGYEMTNRFDYEANNAASDSFFGSPTDVCLNLLYDQTRP